MIDEALAGFSGAPFEVLIGDPTAVQRPAKVGRLRDQIHCRVDGLRMKFGDLGGIIRESNVQMFVRDNGDGPFFCRRDGYGRSRQISPAHGCFDVILPFGEIEFQSLLSELIGTRERLLVRVAVHQEFYRAAFWQRR